MKKINIINANLKFQSVAAWLLLATAYAVAFFQRMAPQSINNELITIFNLTPTGVAFIASGYFWGYTIMQLPAGPLVDRFGLRKMILISTLISALGSFLFAITINPSMAFFSRALIACGDAFVFTSLLKLVSVSFQGKNFGLMSGLSQASGYLGGALASAPLALLVSTYGLPSIFFSVSCFVLIISIGCYAFVRKVDDNGHKTSIVHNLSIINRLIIKHSSFWAIVIVNASQIAIITILAGVWGLAMISNYFTISQSIAGWGIIMFMVGSVLGTILIGKFVDIVTDNSHLLTWIFIIELILLLFMFPLIAHMLGFYTMLFVLFLLGFFTSGSIPSILFTVRKIFTVSLVSTGASLCMTIAGIVTAVLLPLTGWVISWSQKHYEQHLAITESFNMLVIILLLIAIIGLLATFWLRSRNIKQFVV